MNKASVMHLSGLNCMRVIYLLEAFFSKPFVDVTL